jgi:hypothetical protein
MDGSGLYRTYGQPLRSLEFRGPFLFPKVKGVPTFGRCPKLVARLREMGVPPPSLWDGGLERARKVLQETNPRASLVVEEKYCVGDYGEKNMPFSDGGSQRYEQQGLRFLVQYLQNLINPSYCR